MRNAVALPLVLLVASCVPTHPVGVLQREARKQDREWVKDYEKAPEDGRYWVHRTEVLAVAVDTIEGFAPLVEVTPDQVRSDWVYSSSGGIDTGGEWVDQERVRGRAVVAGEHELGLALNKRTETRKLRAGLDAGGWAGSETEWAVEEAQAELARLEALHLAQPRLEGDEDRFRRVATELSPKGYSVVTDEPGSLVIERYVTEGKASTNGKKNASWHSRSQIELAIEGNVVRPTLRAEHRFDTEEGPGEWEAAESTDAQRARAWVKALLADPRSGLVLGEPNRPTPPSVDREPTPAPKVARLRTLPEIQTIITNRAVETSTGDFRICTVGALLPPYNPAGGTWDVDPAMPEGGKVAASGPRTPGQILGEPVSQDRGIDSLPDTGTFKRELVLVEAFMAQANLTEHAMRLENELPGFTPLRLPSSPDTKGKVVAGARSVLEVIPDRMVATWTETCFEKRFESGLPMVAVELADAEESGPDEPIATCDLDLVTVITKGDQGVRCGDARIYFSVTYLFDEPQIELVGLPKIRE